eukprot:GHVU01112048.1.p1 GENE.GHVU01112048.1~~GHVU01112048.1.p1  ORF type:complete len:1244 (-),score=166.16 GHVU01112048.1:116-3619(-)
MAIEMTWGQMFSPSQARHHIPHIAIIITDGGSDYPNKTAVQSDLAKSMGVTIFAIGVGQKVDTEELYRIATSEDYVFTVENYAALDLLKQLIAWKACHVTTLPPPQHVETCQERLVSDIVFAGPDQANAADTDSVLYFIRNITSQLIIGPTKTQISVTPRVCSVMNQNSDAVKGIHLNTYDTKEAFSLRLDSRRLSGTPTSYHVTNLNVFAYLSASGGREDASKVGVLIIDNMADNWQQTQAQAQQSKDNGVRLMIVVVGNSADLQIQAEKLASSKSDVFVVESYENITSLTEWFINELCAGSTFPEPIIIPTPTQGKISYCPGKGPADIVFSLPDHADPQETEAALYLIKNITEEIIIDSDVTRAAVTSRMCAVADPNSDARQEIHLNAHDTNEAFKLRLDARRLPGTPTLHHLTELDVSAYSSENGSREQASKIGVLVIDNTADRWQETLTQAQRVKDKDVELMVLVVGNVTGVQEQAHKIASNPSGVFYAQSYDNIMDVKQHIIDQLCLASTPVITAPPTPAQILSYCENQNYVDIVFTLPDQADPQETDAAITFVQNVTDTMNIGNDKTLAGLTPRFCGIMDTASGAMEGIQLNSHDTNEAFKARLDARRLKGTPTSQHLTNLNLFAYSSINGAREGANKVSVLILDNTAENWQQAQIEAKQAKENNIHLMTVVVGNTNDVADQAKRIASNASDVFYIDSYDKLMMAKDNLLNEICQVTTKPIETPEPIVVSTTPSPPISYCGNENAADIVFALPDQADPADTEAALQFVKNVTDRIILDSPQNQAGVTPRFCNVMSENSDILAEIKLNAHDTNEAFRKRLDSRRLSGTPTSYHVTNLNVFAYSSASGGREDASKVGVLIIDNMADNWQQTQAHAQQAKDSGIHLMAVVVGNTPGLLSQAQEIASDNASVFQIDTYGNLVKAGITVLDQLCLAITPTPEPITTPLPPEPFISACQEQQITDLVFALPDQADPEETASVLQFIQNVTQRMTIGAEAIQAGLTARVCGVLDPDTDTGTGIHLNAHDTNEAFKQRLDARRLTGTPTLNHMQVLATAAFSSESSGRTSAYKFAIVIIDNKAQHWDKIAEQAQLLRESGIRVMVIAIGNINGLKEQAQEMAFDKTDCLFVPSYNEISNYSETFIGKFCEGLSADGERRNMREADFIYI